MGISDRGLIVGEREVGHGRGCDAGQGGSSGGGGKRRKHGSQQSRGRHQGGRGGASGAAGGVECERASQLFFSGIEGPLDPTTSLQRGKQPWSDKPHARIEGSLETWGDFAADGFSVAPNGSCGFLAIQRSLYLAVKDMPDERLQKVVGAEFAGRVRALSAFGSDEQFTDVTKNRRQIMTGQKFRKLLAAYARGAPQGLEEALENAFDPHGRQSNSTRSKPKDSTKCAMWATYTEHPDNYWEDGHKAILEHFLPCLNLRVLVRTNCESPCVFEHNVSAMDRSTQGSGNGKERTPLNLFVLYTMAKRANDKGDRAHYDALSLRDPSRYWTEAAGGASTGQAGGGGVDSSGGEVSGTFTLGFCGLLPTNHPQGQAASAEC